MLEKDKIKTEWDFSIFIKDQTEEAINKDLAVSKAECEKFIAKWKDNSFVASPKNLKSALDEYVELMQNFGTAGTAGYFAAYRTYLDQSNPKFKATYNRVVSQSTVLAAELEFFVHAISRMPKKRQSEFLSSSELTKYHHFLSFAFERGKYLLALDSEKILTLKSKVAYDNWADLSQNLLSAEAVNFKVGGKKAEKIGLAKLTANLSDVEEHVRDASSKALTKIFKKYEKIAEVEMNSILENKKIDDELRGMMRPDLTQHLENDIPSEVVDTLIKTVESHNHIAHRFYEFRAKLAKKSKLKYHERKIPLSMAEKKYDFYASAVMVHNLFSDFDPAAGDVIKDLLYNGQVDVFSKKGKYYSAFCTHVQKRVPQFVMLNFQNKFEDVTTIAHEFGHALNHHLTNEKQHTLYNDNPLCIAETASTFFESLFINQQLNLAEPRDRLAMLVDQLDDSVATVFRQIACYKFEQDLHQEFKTQGYLSSEQIGEMFVTRMQEYCGPFVDVSKEYRTWWVHWPHIRSYFYVFSYSFGHLLTKYLLNKYQQNKDFGHNILDFLAMGVSQSTLELLKTIEFDATSPDYWKIGIREIERTLNEAESLAFS